MGRALERAQKLLKLADPNTNPNPNERTAAALQIVDLILARKLVLRETIPELAPAPPRAARARDQRWRRTVAGRDSVCEICGEVVVQGETVYTLIAIFQTLHRHASCFETSP